MFMGDARAFRHAAATDRFVIQLGDLVDRGPDSAGALRIICDLMDAGDGAFVLGNHDFKLLRVLRGDDVRTDPHLAETVRGLDAAMKVRARAAIAGAPLWLRREHQLFVHAGFHTAMMDGPAPAAPDGRPGGVAGPRAVRPTHGRYPAGRLPRAEPALG